MSKEKKLTQAKNFLKALELPKRQCNNRSAWTLLPPANIRPKDKHPCLERTKAEHKPTKAEGISPALSSVFPKSFVWKAQQTVVA